MANAKKCDICGKFYEKPFDSDKVKLHLEFNYYSDRWVDLCDDCYKELCKFVKPTLPEDESVERSKKNE